jgi:hypothetical protein
MLAMGKRKWVVGAAHGCAGRKAQSGMGNKEAPFMDLRVADEEPGRTGSGTARTAGHRMQPVGTFF